MSELKKKHWYFHSHGRRFSSQHKDVCQYHGCSRWPDYVYFENRSNMKELVVLAINPFQSLLHLQSLFCFPRNFKREPEGFS